VAKGTANTYTGKVAEISRLTVRRRRSTSTPDRGRTHQPGHHPGVTGTATASGSTVTFPITGGVAVIHADKSYKPGYVDGVVLHQGSGLTLTKGSTTVSLTDFTIDPGDSVLYGNVNGQYPPPTFRCSSSTASRSRSPRAGARCTSTGPLRT